MKRSGFKKLRTTSLDQSLQRLIISTIPVTSISATVAILDAAVAAARQEENAAREQPCKPAEFKPREAFRAFSVIEHQYDNHYGCRQTGAPDQRREQSLPQGQSHPRISRLRDISSVRL